MVEKFNNYFPADLENRNAFVGYFKSAGEFKSLISNMVRRGETDLDKIRNNPLRFVSQLIGKEEAMKLNSGEINVFVKEAERVILENEKIRRSSLENLEKQALEAGFVDEGYYNVKGEKVLRGDIEAFQQHVNGYDGDEDE